MTSAADIKTAPGLSPLRATFNRTFQKSLRPPHGCGRIKKREEFRYQVGCLACAKLVRGGGFSGIKMKIQRRQYGFTLTEIIVVLAILAVLATILLAALSRAREYARIATCLSNLHQLSLAALSYAQHNRGALPSDYQMPGGYWYNEITPYDNNIAANAICPDAATPSNGIGTATTAWGPVNPAGPYGWLQGATASYGLNNYVNPGNSIPGISSFASVSLSGNQTFSGTIASAGSVTGGGNLTVYGNIQAGGTINTHGHVYISGTQTPNMPSLQPPSVAAIYQNIENTDNPLPVSGSTRVINFTNNPYQIINGDLSTSGQIQIIGSGTLLVSGDIDISGWFPANGLGTANINLVCLGNINFSGQVNINGGIYAGGGLSLSGRYNLSGVMVSDGAFADSGRGTYVQSPPPSFDPRAGGRSITEAQPLFGDCIWVDGSPTATDPVPSNLNLGDQTLNANDQMGRFCIDRHLGQINVSFTDGSAHTVPLAQLWQLNWSGNFRAKTVVVP